MPDVSIINGELKCQTKRLGQPGETQLIANTLIIEYVKHFEDDISTCPAVFSRNRNELFFLGSEADSLSGKAVLYRQIVCVYVCVEGNRCTSSTD